MVFIPYWVALTRKLGLASSQKVQLNKKREGKSGIGGAKYAAMEYLPPPSKLSGITFHCITIFKILSWDWKEYFCVVIDNDKKISRMGFN